MVMRPDIQKKRVKDLEPGDKIWFCGLAYEAGQVKDGQRRLNTYDSRGHLAHRSNVGANSLQWVEVIENSKRITND